MSMHPPHQPPQVWLASQIIAWQQRYGRNNLPWQQNPTPYRVWISEIMLQQTQVTTVIDYYQRFMQRFPTIAALAQASEDKVLTLWAGLGYYSRARNLHKAAQTILEKHHGLFPDDLDTLNALPGIGRSTAAAILALAHGKRAAILDGNVKRVLCRVHAIKGWPGTRSIETKLWSLAEHHLPHKQLRIYTQGLMDLGATLCTRKRPTCEKCPLNQHCQAYATNTVEQLPTPRPKKERPKKHTILLIIFNSQHQVLMVKRPPAGIWGGLWSLPQVTTETGSYQGIAYRILACGTRIRHQFSHFQLTMRPLYAHTSNNTKIMERPDHGWYNMHTILDIGLAAPIKKLLTHGCQPHEFNLPRQP